MARLRTLAAIAVCLLAVTGCTSSNEPEPPADAGTSEAGALWARTASITIGDRAETIVWDVCSSADETSMDATGTAQGGGAVEVKVSGGSGTLTITGQGALQGDVTSLTIDAAGALSGSGTADGQDFALSGQCQL